MTRSISEAIAKSIPFNSLDKIVSGDTRDTNVFLIARCLPGFREWVSR